MTSNEIKHQAKLEEWAGVIRECRSSGLSVKEWCGRHGVTPTTYYRWERQLLRLASGQASNPRKLIGSPTFAELPTAREKCHPVAQQAATVHIKDIAIDIYPSMDSETLKMLLETLKIC